MTPRVPRFARTPSGAVGLAMLLLVVAVALIGPFVAPHSPDVPVGPPGAPPSDAAFLGTDFLGRDVLSRVLHGGMTVLGLSILATALCYTVGLTVGVVAGYSRSLVDSVLMRTVDVLLAFPALLLLLILVAGLGTSVPVLLLGVVLVQVPGVARVMRTATLETSTRSYVEAAVARGERMPTVLVRDIVPNIAEVILADFGLRFGWSVVLIASMNFLGLGLQPPTSDWGLMMAENRDFISLNALTVLAPAAMLAFLTVSINLIGDSYVRTLGSSTPSAARKRAAAVASEPTPR